MQFNEPAWVIQFRLSGRYGSRARTGQTRPITGSVLNRPWRRRAPSCIYPSIRRYEGYVGTSTDEFYIHRTHDIEHVVPIVPTYLLQLNALVI